MLLTTLVNRVNNYMYAAFSTLTEELLRSSVPKSQKTPDERRTRL